MFFLRGLIRSSSLAMMSLSFLTMCWKTSITSDSDACEAGEDGVHETHEATALRHEGDEPVLTNVFPHCVTKVKKAATALKQKHNLQVGYDNTIPILVHSPQKLISKSRTELCVSTSVRHSISHFTPSVNRQLGRAPSTVYTYLALNILSFICIHLMNQVKKCCDLPLPMEGLRRRRSSRPSRSQSCSGGEPGL
jgi:hypothetical protein